MSGLRKTSHIRVLRQASKYGLVGILATAVHVSSFMVLVELGLAAPLLANLVSFSLGVGISFVANWKWTFASGQTSIAEILRMAGKFFSIALLGFCLNSLWVFLVTEILGSDYALSLPLIAVVTPGVLFFCNKCFVFK